MKKIVLSLLLSALFCASVLAQTFEKPTLTPTEATPAQKTLIEEGARLHDQKLYDEAIINYEKVLKENPACVAAIYELTLSLYYKKSVVRTLESAYDGLKYKSPLLPKFIEVIASIYDDQGTPEKAVELYQEGIKMLEGDKENQISLGSLYFNLAVTKMRQEKVQEARENVKKAITLNYAHPSPHFLLSQIYFNGNYKIPAFLAASRLISLEVRSRRATIAAKTIQSVMQGGVTPGKNPNELTINLDPSTPKDEGDFGSLELLLGLTKAGSDTLPGSENLTAEERFAGQIEKIISLLEEDQKIGATFVGRQYVPFMIELKKQGHIKPFAYIVLFHTGNAEAEKWLNENDQQATAFLSWARTYQNPVK